MSDLSSTPEWVSDAVFYQIFPDRFSMSSRVAKPGPLEPWDAPPTFNGFKGGDLLGIAEQLDYLTDLGVNALYLNPIFSSASNHRYHTYDYFQVDPLLGGNDAFRELLDTCHARGVRVVLDGVFNHSGRGFWPFHHVVETGEGSPYVDWFYVDRQTLHSKGLRPYPTAEESRRMSEVAGPNRTGSDSKRELGYQAWWDLPALPKLNTNNPQMREHLMRASEFWVEFGIDGWRLDVAEEIDADFWREWRRRVRAVNPDAFITAEIWREKPEWVTGDTFDSMMNYPLTEALLSFTAARYLDNRVVSEQHEYRDFVRPIDGVGFASRLEHIMSMYRPEAIRTQLNLLDSHDTPRYVTVAGGDRDSYRLASLAIFTLPGAPCVYYGSEVGVEGSHDPDCRRAFPWDESRWDAGLRSFVRALAQTRHDVKDLRRGAFKVVAAAGDAVAYERGNAVVVINSGEETARLSIPGAGLSGKRVAELPGWGPLRVAADGSVSVDRRSGGILL
ncbi:MAG TPA: glycoside hydrolase family 13 protein [Candidatus Limnocylindrales bacterium]|nr:glycoside hydrolase family 13 protein [Candidatus Limnocylindrales bacterium]